jgi:RHS repeat-associated protein
LKQVILPNGQNVVYKYDAFGRRIERNVNSTTWTKFTYDGQDVILDQNSDGKNVTYLNGADIDSKLRQTVGGQAQYFLNDHLGSTTALTDATGATIASTNYDSFGNATNANLPTRYQFTGREYDNFTGLQYSRARWYDANLGRFISEDPIGFAGGDINLYGYVRNRPNRFRDPKGLQIPEEIEFEEIENEEPFEEELREGYKRQIERLYGFSVLGRSEIDPEYAEAFERQWEKNGFPCYEPVNIQPVMGPRIWGYAPNSRLPQQNVGGVDIPTPLPEAMGPHTTLGTRVGSDGIPYRQSATFPGGTFPRANG